MRFKCPLCGKIEDRNGHGGVVCTKCGVFMHQTDSAPAAKRPPVEKKEVKEDG